MRTSARFLSLGIAALCLVVLGFWWVMPKTEESPRMERRLQVAPDRIQAVPDSAPAISQPPIQPTVSLADDADDGRPPLVALGSTPLGWERQIADAARAGGEGSTAGARAIFALIPTLPEEALATATETALRQLTDGAYPDVALPVLRNPQTHGQVLSVLFADLLERPSTIALSSLLTVARSSSHPFAAVARDDLKLLLSADHANDWQAWSVAISAALAAETP